MVTLTERTIMKSRSGIYEDTSENRRKHRVGQKYGDEKQPEDGEKTEKKETDPAKELEAVNKVIAAINEGKLNLPAAEVMKLSEKKQKLEAAKKQAEKINTGVKANEEKKNAEEAKETSKKINEAQKKGVEKKEESSSKKYAEMDIKEAKKELLGKEITFKKYFFDGVDSYKDAVGKINQVRLYGKEKQPVLAADFPNGDSIQISLKQLDERKASKYEIVFDEKVSEEKTEKKETDPKEEPKSEPKQSEAEESYTRVKFDDVPNSGKVNLKKYLSDKVRNQADENLGVLSKVSFENLQTMEKGLVKEFNSQFGSLSKSRRAEKLYSIMKVKSELENRKQEESKKYQKYTSSLDDNTLLSIGYDLGEEIRKLSSRGFSTLEQQQEVLKKISELSGKRQINEDEQRKRMDKLNNSPDETRVNKKGELAKRGNESQKKE